MATVDLRPVAGGVHTGMKTTQEIIDIAIAAGAMLACIWLSVFAYLPEHELRQVATGIIHLVYLVSVVIGLSVSIGAVAGLFLLGWMLYSRGIIWHSNARLQQAAAIQAAREAHLAITVAPPGSQIIVSEVAGLNVSHRPLHLAAGKVNGGLVVHTEEERRAWLTWNFTYGNGGSQRATAETLQLAAPDPVPDLLSILDTAQRVLIKAPSDGGKTNLLQHIAARRQGAVLVIDSQAYPGKWPKCSVVGTGSNHRAISAALDRLIELMVKRYREIGEGLVREGEHPKLTIIIDEWMAIVDQCPNAPDAIRRLLTESRKAAFSVFIGSHSERVRSLGLDGRGDLRDGFLIVRVWLENGERQATFDYGRGERACVLPGKFAEPDERNVVEIEAIAAQPMIEEKPLIDPSRVLRLFDGGECVTPTAICIRLFGYKKTDLIRDIRGILIAAGRLG